VVRKVSGNLSSGGTEDGTVVASLKDAQISLASRGPYRPLASLCERMTPSRQMACGARTRENDAGGEFDRWVLLPVTFRRSLANQQDLIKRDRTEARDSPGVAEGEGTIP